MVRFDWDDLKSKANLKKHGISFDEASTVFTSEPIRIFADIDHSSQTEDRMFAIGYSYTHRLPLVVHCYFEDKNTIRIISARKVTKTEKKFFEEK